MEVDATYNDNIYYKELDENGRPISRPDIDELIAIHDSPSVKDGDTYTDMKVILLMRDLNKKQL